MSHMRLLVIMIVVLDFAASTGNSARDAQREACFVALETTTSKIADATLSSSPSRACHRTTPSLASHELHAFHRGRQSRKQEILSTRAGSPLRDSSAGEAKPGTAMGMSACSVPRDHGPDDNKEPRSHNEVGDVENQEWVSNSNRAIASVAYLWWKTHKEKHKQIPAENLEILYSNGALGGGAYGEVFHAVVRDEEGREIQAVAKRAKDGSVDLDDPRQDGSQGLDSQEALDDIPWEQYVDMLDMHNQSFRFLQVEAFINDVVQASCPEVAAPYLGICRKQGTRWLVWEHVGGASLQDLLVQSTEAGSLRPLAEAMKISGFRDDASSLQRLVNEVARQLLQCCAGLERAGVAHRDVKPDNVLVADGRLRLIDFGSAAAMDFGGRAGYDPDLAPCDVSYAPPEKFIDERAWAAYDVYCVGLTLVRVLFQPLWSGWHWREFVDAYAAAGHDLERWIGNVADLDPGVRPRATSGWLESLWRWLGWRRGERGAEYAEEAAESCAAGADEGGLSMCSLRVGLEVLNVERGGVCWRVLRGMLAASPRARISAAQALEGLRLDKVTAWATWRERRDKMRQWHQQRRQQQQAAPPARGAGRRLEEGVAAWGRGSASARDTAAQPATPPRQ